jgi:DNA-binding NarL/FixJ family response regulator
VDPLRCFIVDDDASFLEAARVMLEADGMTVAGTARTGAGAVEQVDVLRPDVVLVDIRLGAEFGFTVAQRLAAAGTHAALIMISTDAEDDYADLLAESPALGFLSKAALSGPAIRRILS